MKYRIIFYRSPEPDGKRIRKMGETLRDCGDAAEATAFAARCLGKTGDDMRAQVVRVVVEQDV